MQNLTVTFLTEYLTKLQNEGLIDHKYFSIKHLSLILEYLHLLEKWNKKIDLISPTPPDLIFKRHIVDSLMAWSLLCSYFSVQGDGIILDIGSGAGFPGVIFAIEAFPQQVVLCEPRYKRSAFLNEVIRALELKNVEVFSGRVEELINNAKNEGFALAISRALKLTPTLLLSIGELLKNDGIFGKMQGASTLNVTNSMKFSGKLRYTESLKYSLPEDTRGRSLDIWKCFT